MTTEPVERRVQLPAQPGDVWKALTDGDQISEWFGAEVELVPERGGRARFVFPDGSRRGAVIEAFEPERLLVLRWLPFAQDAAGKTEARPSTNVRFTLKPSERGTLLVVQESVPAPWSPEAGGPSDRGFVTLGLDARVGP